MSSALCTLDMGIINLYLLLTSLHRSHAKIRRVILPFSNLHSNKSNPVYTTASPSPKPQAHLAFETTPTHLHSTMRFINFTTLFVVSVASIPTNDANAHARLSHLVNRQTCPGSATCSFGIDACDQACRDQGKRVLYCNAQCECICDRL
ncbi:hypothetical protein BKA58DRAFT_375387 [Alternaria rosae]|uniref:uncharacterized protein n=1 Tax=Alternaria rosae TaxID=1187941 RepID=UPI001E8D3F87|nr:uncharacterized protein BKA58DRAFT_375387 [Alternaria rosae]KAH6877550.1 hypothetical protein BKA58DRAFT_375387 [Alternaria rosae]